MNNFKFTENDVNLNDEYKEQLTPAISEKGIKAMPGYQEQTSDSIDHGIIQVPVKDLPMLEGVASPGDSDYHISWQDTMSAYNELPQIQADIASGKTGDDFLQEDYEAEVDWQHGKK